jgi:hypothetical protein
MLGEQALRGLKLQLRNTSLYATCPVERGEEVATAIREAFMRAGHVVIGNKIKLRIETHTYIHPEHYEEDREAQAM